MSNAATSALKLHQRVSSIPFQMNREYMANIFVEDSFHYLMYSFIFLNTQPVTSKLSSSNKFFNLIFFFNIWIKVIFIPICVFALLHVISYTIAILNVSKNNFNWFVLWFYLIEDFVLSFWTMIRTHLVWLESFWVLFQPKIKIWWDSPH